MQSSEWKLRKCRQAGIEFFHYTVLCFLIFCFFAMQLQWESVPRTNWTPPSSRDGGGGVTAVASRRWRHACGGAQEVALWTDFKTPWLVSTMFFYRSIHCPVKLSSIEALCVIYVCLILYSTWPTGVMGYRKIVHVIYLVVKLLV